MRNTEIYKLSAAGNLFSFPLLLSPPPLLSCVAFRRPSCCLHSTCTLTRLVPLQSIPLFLFRSGVVPQDSITSISGCAEACIVSHGGAWGTLKRDGGYIVREGKVLGAPPFCLLLFFLFLFAHPLLRAHTDSCHTELVSRNSDGC